MSSGADEEPMTVYLGMDTGSGKPGVMRLPWMMYLLLAARAVHCTWFVNVTFAGLLGNATVNHVPGWSVTIVRTTPIVEYGACTVGFSCPIGTTDPVPCPHGMLGSETETGPMCVTPCPADHYCPNATAAVPCPEHTFSAEGSWSMESCLCEDGYECTYARDLDVRVPLNVTIGHWTIRPEDQQQLLQAVYDAMLAAPGAVGLTSTSVVL